tara:strand:+ start:246 stop:599 length:354 start_codon:yes stop_codon:yes gene_type:complete
MSKQDLTRYCLEDVQESIKDKYSDEQFTQVLLKSGYNGFPSNGITDKGFRKFMKELSKIDEKESNLKRVNVWGICGKLEKCEDHFVAWDRNIDIKTGRELRQPIEEMYSEEVEIAFF